uniref:LOB domain-containing protein n=1 Tax=Araucaria cunninghamii TaxID=56994 RepID=A0A0D6R527_ARACU
MTATPGTSVGQNLGQRKQQQQGAESRQRMSCNGCRVLRKGCSDTCILRPCLQWIESPEAQGHATVFVAKFFGRAGLMAFISAVPDNQRPALFQSLLYEACGRTVNPVNGAVGLLWSGNWQICQAAVDTVLKGGTLRPPQSSSSGMATCSTRPSLMNNNNSFSATVRNNRHAIEMSKFKAVDEVYTVKSGSSEFARVNYSSPQPPQQHQLMTVFKVKAEPPETQDLSLRGTFDPLRHDQARIHPSPSDMAPRRVRQRVEGNETSSTYSNYDFHSPDIKFLREFQPDVVEVKANLDLTLNCDHSSPSHFNKRVSSPSIVSVNSEGSVTSLESGSLQKTFSARDRKVLDLFL